MKITLSGVVVIVGNYGSGKTEVAVNLAVRRKADGLDVTLADLDLVNPYFRSREARAVLARHSVPVVLPPVRYLHADLPILTPEVAGLIRRRSGLVILDVGGDDVGATVLAALADALREGPIELLQVINPHRPYTGTVAGCLNIRAEIEAAAKLAVTGIVGNANLIDETTAEVVCDGYRFAGEVARAGRLPLRFITAPAELTGELAADRFSCPVLPIHRQMVPPWRKARLFPAAPAN